METIGQRIKAIRKHYRLSQDRFGELCGVSKGSVSQWEKDQTTPELSKLIQIRKELSFSFDYLFTGSQDYNAAPERQHFAVKEPTPHHARPLVQQVCDLAEQIDDNGLRELVGFSRCLTGTHPLVKPKAA